MVPGAAVPQGSGRDRFVRASKTGEETMSRTNKTTRSDRNRKAIAGVKKHYANAPSIVVNGVSYKPSDVERVLQDSIDAADATSSTATAFHKAVEAEKAANVKGDVLYRGLRTYLITQFRTNPETLDDFGITLTQKQVPDAKKVATAVEKRAATRKARSTMGKRQKAAIKGQMPVIPPPNTAKPA
jgi:hypothetical protein